MANTKHFEKALKWVEKNGFSQVKANYESYECPSRFSRQGDTEPIIPDITAIKTGGKNYIEIALKSEDVANKVSKWKLLSTMASRKGGKLILLAPKGHKSFTRQLTEDYFIPATVVSI